MVHGVFSFGAGVESGAGVEDTLNKSLVLCYYTLIVVYSGLRKERGKKANSCAFPPYINFIQDRAHSFDSYHICRRQTCAIFSISAKEETSTIISVVSTDKHNGGILKKNDSNKTQTAVKTHCIIFILVSTLFMLYLFSESQCHISRCRTTELKEESLVYRLNGAEKAAGVSCRIAIGCI